MLAFRDGRTVAMCDGCYGVIELRDFAPRGEGEPTLVEAKTHFHGQKCQDRWKPAQRVPEPHLEQGA